MPKPKGSIRRTPPPSVNEVVAFSRELGSKIDPHFFDHYDAIGWVDGSGRPIENWQAKFRISGNGMGLQRQSGDGPSKGKRKARLPTPEEQAAWNPYDGGPGAAQRWVSSSTSTTLGRLTAP